MVAFGWDHEDPNKRKNHVERIKILIQHQYWEFTQEMLFELLLEEVWEGAENEKDWKCVRDLFHHYGKQFVEQLKIVLDRKSRYVAWQKAYKIDPNKTLTDFGVPDYDYLDTNQPAKNRDSWWNDMKLKEMARFDLNRLVTEAERRAGYNV